MSAFGADSGVGSLSVVRGPLAAAGGEVGHVRHVRQVGLVGLVGQNGLGAARDAVWSSKSPFVRRAEGLGVSALGADNPPIITGRRITKGERGGGTRRPGADSPSHQTAPKLPIDHGNAMFLKPAPAGAMRSKNVNPLLCKKAERVVHVFADLIAAPRASTAYRTPRTRHRVLPGRRGCRGTADTPPCAGSTRMQVVPRRRTSASVTAPPEGAGRTPKQMMA